MTSTADAIREVLMRDPDISVNNIIAALPDHNENTVRTLVSRYRNKGTMSGTPALKQKQEIENTLIADHLAGKITAEQLSAALHMRGRVETQRKALVDAMIRANVAANALSAVTTEEELMQIMAEKHAIITVLGGTPPVLANIPPIPQAA
jgi:predicted transcriptional regulator